MLIHNVKVAFFGGGVVVFKPDLDITQGRRFLHFFISKKQNHVFN